MFPRLIGPLPSASTGAVPRNIPRANSRIIVDNTQFFKSNPYCSQLLKLAAVTSSVRCVLRCCEEDSLCELGPREGCMYHSVLQIHQSWHPSCRFTNRIKTKKHCGVWRTTRLHYGCVLACCNFQCGRRVSENNDPALV